MFCSKCGKSVGDGNRFCDGCGAPLTQGSSPAPANNSRAVWESKAIQVHPANENSTIELYETFGWELKSSQTIDKTDTDFKDGWNDDIIITKTRERYVKLTFRRDKNMPAYRELCELEAQYYAADREEGLELKEAPRWMLVVGVILALWGLWALITYGPDFVVSAIMMFVIAAPLIFIYIKKKKEYDSVYDEYLKNRENATATKYNCIEQAKRLR